jgi:hypothetical protein
VFSRLANRVRVQAARLHLHPWKTPAAEIRHHSGAGNLDWRIQGESLIDLWLGDAPRISPEKRRCRQLDRIVEC